MLCNNLMRRASLGETIIIFINTVGASGFWKVFNKYKWDVGSIVKTIKSVCQPLIRYLLEKLYSLLFFRVEAMISTEMSSRLLYLKRQ